MTATILRLENACSVDDVDQYFSARNISGIGEKIGVLKGMLDPESTSSRPFVYPGSDDIEDFPSFNKETRQETPGEVYVRMADRLARNNILALYDPDIADQMLSDLPDPCPQITSPCARRMIA